jgi:hypothetical protein
VKANFVEALQRYQKVEQKHRDKQRERVARQFKIVKEDATPEEIAAVVDNSGPGSDQIFAQAVCAPSAIVFLCVVDGYCVKGFVVYQIQRGQDGPTRRPGKTRGHKENREDAHRTNAAIQRRRFSLFVRLYGGNLTIPLRWLYLSSSRKRL